MKRPLLALAAVWALAAAPAARAATVRHTRAGERAAVAAVLHRGDLSTRWHVSAPPPAAVPPLTCAAFRPAAPGVVEIGSAASAVLSPGQEGPFVSETAFVFASSEQAAADFGAVARPRLAACLAASLRRATGSGVSFTVDGRVAMPAAAVGRPAARARGYRITGEAHLGSGTASVVLDTVLLARGPVLAAVTVADVFGGVDPALERRIVAAAARRG